MLNNLRSAESHARYACSSLTHLLVEVQLWLAHKARCLQNLLTAASCLQHEQNLSIEVRLSCILDHLQVSTMSILKKLLEAYNHELPAANIQPIVWHKLDMIYKAHLHG